MLSKSYIYITAVLLSTVIFALAGCGGTSTSQNGHGAITAKLVWNSSKTTGKIVASAPAGVLTVRLAISGAGITAIQQDFPAADGKGTLNSVQAGSGLTVTASGLDSSGIIIYQGSVGNVTVQNGTTTDAGIITMAAVNPTTAVFTSAMISGKTFNYSDTIGNSGTPTFFANGTYGVTNGDSGTWSINATGMLVLVETSGGTDTMTLTANTGTIITASDYFAHGDGTFETFTVTLTEVAQTTPTVFTTAMISGKSFNCTNDNGVSYNLLTFRADEVLLVDSVVQGTWSINGTGQVIIQTTSGGMDTLTFTSTTGTVITAGDVFNSGSAVMTLAFIDIPNTFSMPWLSGKTFYQVWFGQGNDPTNDAPIAGNVPVVIKVIFGADGVAQVSSLLNGGTSKSGSYGVDASGLLYFAGNTTDGNSVTSASTKDYIKTRYTINGTFDNVDLFFFDQNTAMTYASTLTSSIP